MMPLNSCVKGPRRSVSAAEMEFMEGAATPTRCLLLLALALALPSMPLLPPPPTLPPLRVDSRAACRLLCASHRFMCRSAGGKKKWGANIGFFHGGVRVVGEGDFAQMGEGGGGWARARPPNRARGGPLPKD